MSIRKKVLLSIPLLLLAATILFAGWLLRTTAGASWLLSLAARSGAIDIQIRHMQGSLTDNLLLEGILVRWDSGEVEAAEFHLNWQPRDLLVGRLHLTALELKQVVIRLPAEEGERVSPDGPVSLRWPDFPEFFKRVKVRVDNLGLQDIVLERAGAEVFTGSLSTRLELTKGRVALEQLSLDSSAGHVRGFVRADLLQPSLEGVLEADWPQPVHEVDRLTLSMQPVTVKGSLLAARLELSAAAGEKVVAALDGELSLFSDRVLFKDWTLTQGEHTGQAKGRTELHFAEKEPWLEADLQLTAWDLSPELGTSTSLSGNISLEGSVSGYSGRFDLINKHSGWEGVALAGTIGGDKETLSASDLQGRWLDGEIVGDIAVGWSQEFSLRADVKARALNPSQIGPPWPAGPVDVDARLTMEEGTLLAAFLHLQGQGADIRLQGESLDRLEVTGHLTSAQTLLPVEIHQGVVQGWAGWREGQPFGNLAIHSSRLVGFGAAMDNLALSLIRTHPAAPFILELKTDDISYRTLAFNSLHTTLQGTPEDHEGYMQLHWPTGQGQLALRGDYGEKQWRGILLRLGWDDVDRGSWNLQETVELHASGQEIGLTPLVLSNQQGGRVQLEGSVEFNPLVVTTQAQWQNLNLALLNAWSREVKVTGKTDGSMTLDRFGAEEGRVLLHTESSGSLARKGEVAEISHLRVDTDWSPSGLQGQAKILLPFGEISAQILSDQPTGFTLPPDYDFSLTWKEVHLDQFAMILGSLETDAVLTGRLQGRYGDESGLVLDGTNDFSGSFLLGDLHLEAKAASLGLVWDYGRFAFEGDVQFEEGGSLAAHLQSKQGQVVEAFNFPRQGDVSVQWSHIDLIALRPFMPLGVDLLGALSGEVRGHWLEGWQLDLTGSAAILDGQLEYHDEQGLVSVPLRESRFALTWQKEHLQGEISLVLAEHGHGHGSFRLPLAARLPTSLRVEAPMQGALAVSATEKGLLAAVMPGVIQESEGDIELDLSLGGTWLAPQLRGQVGLTGGGAYVPAAGIQVKDVQLKARFDDSRVEIETFRCQSGGGSLQGEGIVQLKQWRLADYRFSLQGNRFEVIRLPELQVKASPVLVITGTQGYTSITGEVQLPEILVFDRQAPATLRASHDVIVVGQEDLAKKARPWQVEGQVRFVLGDRALVKVGGVDARLEGAVTVNLKGIDRITAQGQISVVDGAYAAYGLRLDIDRGSIVFGGGPVDQPSLDILALRHVGEVRAGVQVTGTPRAPVVKLYSEPLMPDTDILSYVVLGRPLEGETGDSSALMLAAGALLTKGESTVLQDKIRRRFGLDVLDIQAGSGDVETSMVTIGKYLSPSLYISLGHSLFTQTNEVRLRYDISKRWQLETEMGTVSGADLFYKVEFQ
ncbi:translocation/assembly module TamB domain-containing protein [Desulfuromonas sp. AOP6]|uniref:translocation/assembly module TamB domain-containing protein n=1 Tax=Desulfuromonas sp. AOP6 TaxID=1566351 RepID=UPI0012865AE4|nr:translocation/assembly module TamB domain-containing protein [Desulfuromonas sp. AOP6]BCA79864.1 hypothetical protein AOP6_1651 [Desulfuromonas sp. AOP6]